jgi:ribosomal protein S18 acetylase RimI-like enzyme
MNPEFTIREYCGGNDDRQLESVGLPQKYVRQYTNSPPFYAAAKLFGICTHYLYLLVQVPSSQVVGTILLRRRFDFLHARYVWKMHAVYVAPQLRGRGLGVELVLHALDRLRERGVGEVSLKVDEDNTPAISLYKKCGFVEEAKRHGQLVLVKSVT